MIQLDLHLLNCGHGDTLLLKLPGPKWVLVDCHLRSRAVKKHFFEFAEVNQIRRLDLVVLTHPHFDHYAGMAEVIEYFTRDGREVGAFCDSGMNWKHVLAMLEAKGRPKDELKEYHKLIHALLARPAIRRRRLDEARSPIRVNGTKNAVQLIPIAPEEHLIITTAEQALNGEKPTASENDLSIVMVVQTRTKKTACQMLLTADVETGNFPRVLDVWKQHDENLDKTCKFTVVKIPHHGSKSGHYPPLCKLRDDDNTCISVVSVGTQYRLPKRPVISDYLTNKWTLASTTVRQSVTRSNRLIDQFGKKSADVVETVSQDIMVSWNSDTGTSWMPPESEIRQQDLDLYEK